MTSNSGRFARSLGVLALLVVTIAWMASGLATGATPPDPTSLPGLDPLFLVPLVPGMLALPRALDLDELVGQRKPPAGAVDVYPDVLYSTMIFPAAGQPIRQPLQFFQGAETNPRDPTLTNVAQGFLIGQRFHAYYAFIVPLTETTLSAGAVATAAAGRARDVDRVLKTNRGFIEYTYSVTNKTRGPFPLDAFGEMGAIMPDFGGNNVPAAGDNALLNHVRTGASGGWPLNLILFENEGFPFNMTWGVQTAISADLPIRLVLFGWRYVRQAA